MAQKRGWLLLQDLVLPQCFYMPITQAAKEPSLGLATSKKRCRENPTWAWHRWRKGAGSWKLRGFLQIFACNKAEALMAENLSSDTPKFWHEQNLLRILTKRGRDTLSPRSKWSILLNLCFRCPYLTILSLRRTRRFCGGESSSFPTFASNMLC